MIQTAVILPAAPLLLPGVNGGPVAQVEELRAACVKALSGISGPVVVVGTAGSRHVSRVSRPKRGEKGELDSSTGENRDVPVGHPPALTRVAPGLTSHIAPVLPVELEVGRSLLRAAGLDSEHASYQPLAADLSPAEAADVGRRLARDPRPSVLVALADGTPCRRESGSPVRYDARAVAFDHALLASLRTGDSAALTGLDPALAEHLHVTGYPTWQVLAAAMPAPTSADVSYADDPFGVFYIVARWAV